jgi:hypothetical protein
MIKSNGREVLSPSVSKPTLDCSLDRNAYNPSLLKRLRRRSRAYQHLLKNHPLTDSKPSLNSENDQQSLTLQMPLVAIRKTL